MKRVEQTNTTVYIIDEENKSVKATIKNTKYDAINSIVKAFNQSPLDASVSPAYFLNTTYSATATCADGDTFDVEKGKAIARKKAVVKYNRAKIKKMKDFYMMLNAVTSSLNEDIKYLDEKFDKINSELTNY